MSHTLRLAGALALAALAACTGRSEDPAPSPDDVPGHQDADEAPLVGTAWSLEALLDVDATTHTTPAGGGGTLLLDDDGRVAGSTGCNRIMGGYEVVDDHTVRFGPLASTRMACSEPLTAQEDHVLAVLQGDVEVTVLGGQLTLVGTDGRGLRFRSGG
jgi:heat shock protein HslJ